MYDDYQAVSEEDFYSWLRPPSAIAALSHLQMEAAAGQIWHRLESNIFKAAAEVIVFPNRSRAERAIIPVQWWSLQAALSNLDFWTTGDLRLEASSGSYSVPDKLVASLFGVRFEPTGISALEASPILPPSRPEAARSKGGRPAASWWPAFSAELAVYVHEEGIPSGEDKEGSEAVIDAILQRLSNRGIEPSRTTVQPVIREVLRRLRSAENSK